MTHDTTTHSYDAQRNPIQMAGEEALTATDAMVECLKQYTRERPEVVTLWAFGIGFVLGWKLKPW